MSRLESAIRRLSAQRACLNAACAMIGAQPGTVLEFGLGNGRTYDHLREKLPGRDIYVFERRVQAHPDCIPDSEHLFEGDFFACLPEAIARLKGTAILVHCDTGTGDKAASCALAARLAEAMPPLLCEGAVICSDQPMEHAHLHALPLPEGVAVGRYFMYRFAPPAG